MEVSFLYVASHKVVEYCPLLTDDFQTKNDTYSVSRLPAWPDRLQADSTGLYLYVAFVGRAWLMIYCS
jgi:hypothetical protein